MPSTSPKAEERDSGVVLESASGVELTRDVFHDGRLELLQTRLGYRVSIDALLVADAAVAHAPRRLLDIGCGCGIIALSVALRLPRTEIVGIERQASLAALARMNFASAAVTLAPTLIEGDVRSADFSSQAPFDVITMNPPFFAAGEGRLNPDGERAAARHQIHGSLSELVDAGRRRLDKSGRFIVIYPAEKSMELLSVLQDAKLAKVRLTPIHSFADRDAELVLAEARPSSARALSLSPPIVFYDTPEDGRRSIPSARVKQMVLGRA